MDGRFTVAGLTAASLFGPIASPPQFAGRAAQLTPGARALVDEPAPHPTFAWVREMFACHR